MTGAVAGLPGAIVQRWCRAGVNACAFHPRQSHFGSGLAGCDAPVLSLRLARWSVTIDGLAKEMQLAAIHWLTIDAEGWDALIIEGARTMIEQRRIALLEFEYHRHATS